MVKGLVDAGRTVLAVAATAREAEDLVTALGGLMDPAQVAYYPAWETLPHERLSPAQRHRRPPARGAAPAAAPRHRPVQRPAVRSSSRRSARVLQPQVKGLADLEPVELAVGDEVELDDVVRRLAGAAYSRVDLVEKRGEFAVRGGIVDVFPPTEEHPLRVEFWGDEVEEIRSFAVADQRTLEPVQRLWAPPCRELLLTDEVRARAKQLGEQHPQLAEIFEKLADGHAVEGMESLAPGAGRRDGDAASTCCPQQTHVLVLDPERARSRAHDLVATSEEFLEASWAAAAGGGQAPIDLGAASYRSLADVRTMSLAQGKAWWSVSPFGLDPDGRRADQPGSRCATRWGRSSAPTWTPRPVRSSPVRCRSARSRPTAATWSAPSPTCRPGWATAAGSCCVHEGHGPAQRMVEVLSEHDVPVRYVESIDAEPERGAGARHAPPPSSTASSTPGSAWRCSPATTSPASARPPRTCARCRPAARSRSTRWSSSPATTSCTSSTASAATSR